MFRFLAQSDPQLDAIKDELVKIGGQMDASLWWQEGVLRLGCIAFGVFLIYFIFQLFGTDVFNEFKS